MQEFGARLLQTLRGDSYFGLAIGEWVLLLVAPGLGFVVSSILLRLLARIAKTTEADWDNLLVERIRAPARLVGAVLFERGALAALDLGAQTEEGIARVLSSLLVIGAAWSAERALYVGTSVMAERYEAQAGDPAAARAARTRLLMLRRVLSVLLMLVAASLVLLQFEIVRQVGVSLLASAGIAGVMLGFAAQKSIATLLAGLQISIAQPVRIGDVVIIEGEWGTIEEITLTFVVVRIWDQRRLVLPIGQLLEKPFQNWTRGSPELMGTIFFHADYTVPIEVLREEVKRVCEEDPDWDGRVAGLLVTDAQATTLQLRALVSAANADKLWDLRCRVRERLVKRLQELEGGRYLPRMRIEGDFGEAAARLEKAGERGTRGEPKSLPPPPLTAPNT
ncbi:mechanosensitive ion channel family protein [Polyangium spumosum]|uniref:Mechanosensitive ion channel n=1 Tax=Polyangium spumosum TaxID=889282 RepID=A0A6N7PVJ1_9BACT|nr:mechanosensitive ion channel domain-containing protein [Polyangium spumosum]MRG96068.1 mechanosensitive ion channel [Polyangium spumosum]